MDWQAFEAWLTADARHRDAYEDIALLDADIDRHRDTLRYLIPATEDAQAAASPTRSRHWAIAGGSLAAALVACIVLVVSRPPSSSPEQTAVISYGADAISRDVRIANANVTLAPRSNIVAAADEPTALTLDGRAIVDVKHDPARTLTIRASGFEIRDVGTRFEIVSGAGAIRVVVAEGEVSLRATRGDSQPIRVTAGHLATGSADGRIVIAQTGATALGGWRTGPLVYSAMPLTLVAADVGRATGTPITIDDRLGTRPFSGVLATGNRDAMVGALTALTGLEARRQGDTIHLVARGSR